MATITDKPRVNIKSKNLQVIINFCIENKLEFHVYPKNTGEDWEVELAVKNVVTAVELGMFLKSNRMELAGNSLFGIPEQVAQPHKVKKTRKKHTTETSASISEPAPGKDPKQGLLI